MTTLSRRDLVVEPLEACQSRTFTHPCDARPAWSGQAGSTRRGRRRRPGSRRPPGPRRAAPSSGTRCRRCGTAPTSGELNSQTTSRPPGLVTRSISRRPGVGVDHVAQPEGDRHRVEGVVGERQPGAVAGRERQVRPVLLADPQHPDREVARDDGGAAGRGTAGTTCRCRPRGRGPARPAGRRPPRPPGGASAGPARARARRWSGRSAGRRRRTSPAPRRASSRGRRASWGHPMHGASRPEPVIRTMSPMGTRATGWPRARCSSGVLLGTSALGYGVTRAARARSTARSGPWPGDSAPTPTARHCASASRRSATRPRPRRHGAPAGAAPAAR